jgi:hypothetical protein
MKVTQEQYEAFRDTTSRIRDEFWKLDNRKTIGNVPITSRFIHCVDNMISELMQVYFEEIKGDEEKELDRYTARLFAGGSKK